MSAICLWKVSVVSVEHGANDYRTMTHLIATSSAMIESLREWADDKIIVKAKYIGEAENGRQFMYRHERAAVASIDDDALYLMVRCNPGVRQRVIADGLPKAQSVDEVVQSIEDQYDAATRSLG